MACSNVTTNEATFPPGTTFTVTQGYPTGTYDGQPNPTQ